MKKQTHVYLLQVDFLKGLAFAILFALAFTGCEKVEDNEGTTFALLNKPPVANAGFDQVITLPIDSILLDGTASKDPEGAMRGWLWTKIYGPASFTIVNPNNSIAVVKGLTAGIYLFEMKVTDADGMDKKDTVQVMVKSVSGVIPLLEHIIKELPAIQGSCDAIMREQVPARMVHLGILSKSRASIAMAATGTKIVLAGGVWSDDCPECFGSSRVDIYDTVSKDWSTAELSKGRSGMGTVVAGSKIFFAGGRNGDGAFDQLFAEIDIYDASTNKWSTARLSQPRAYVSAALVSNKVFFAGGEMDWDYNTSNRVDIYDLENNSWTTHFLGEARAYISAVTLNNNVYFAGGHREDRWFRDPSNKIDIYNNATQTWYTTTLSKPMGRPAGVAYGQDLYWASECTVEIKNANNLSTIRENLFRAQLWLYHSSAVISNGIIIILNNYDGGAERFDIYDPANRRWSVGVLPLKVKDATIIAFNNTIYLSGNAWGNSQLWKLEF